MGQSLQDSGNQPIICFMGKFHVNRPAYAGTTQRSITGKSGIWDHPRLRGNHFFASAPADLSKGSPPLAREPPFASRKLLERTSALLNDYRKLYLDYDGMSIADKNNLKPAISCKKDIWWQMIQLLPSSYNQKRTIMLNYETLANIYHQRKNRKLDEWNILCKWIEELPYAWLITGEVKKMHGRLSIPDQKTLKALRKKYPMGTRIELVQMDGPAAPPVGTAGTVLGIDDLGSIIVRWDNGSHLSVVFGVDECKKLNA